MPGLPVGLINCSPFGSEIIEYAPLEEDKHYWLLKIACL